MDLTPPSPLPARAMFRRRTLGTTNARGTPLPVPRPNPSQALPLLLLFLKLALLQWTNRQKNLDYSRLLNVPLAKSLVTVVRRHQRRESLALSRIRLNMLLLLDKSLKQWEVQGTLRSSDVDQKNVIVKQNFQCVNLHQRFLRLSRL